MASPRVEPAELGIWPPNRGGWRNGLGAAGVMGSSAVRATHLERVREIDCPPPLLPGHRRVISHPERTSLFRGRNEAAAALKWREGVWLVAGMKAGAKKSLVGWNNAGRKVALGPPGRKIVRVGGSQESHQAHPSNEQRQEADTQAKRRPLGEPTRGGESRRGIGLGLMGGGGVGRMRGGRGQSGQ